MKVMELMRTHVVTIAADATGRDAVDKMDLYQVSGLPVIDLDKHVIGMISEHDIIKKMVPSYENEAVGFDHNVDQIETITKKIASLSVSELMTPEAITVEENCDAMTAASLMLQKRIKRIPVTSEGRLVGIISRIDICQAVLEGAI